MKKEKRNLFSVFMSIGSLFAFLNGIFLIGIPLLLGSAIFVTQSLSVEAHLYTI